MLSFGGCFVLTKASLSPSFLLELCGRVSGVQTNCN